MTAFDTLKSIEYGSFSPSLAFAGIDVVNTDYSYAAGKAVMYYYRLKLSGDDGRWSFPALFCRPKGNGPFPAVVNIGFERNVPNKYLPLEEIIDNGFAIAYFCYEDVISDSASFEDGIGELIHFDDKRPGKIAIWAWAASRVFDSLRSFTDCSFSSYSVLGHSRLGKTALLAGAEDSRFSCVISNDSGCSGAALFRGKKGERIEDITRSFPYWFAPGFRDYSGKDDELPFDQDVLLLQIVPRNLLIMSAEEDTWADPDAERRAFESVSGAFEKAGALAEYNVRDGRHYLSRQDWDKAMRFIRKSESLIDK